jgi:hypothetical protein
VKKLSVCFWVLALILSHLMCAAVAYRYCDMLWGIRYAGYSAPAETAFFLIIPFAAGIAVSVLLALFFRHKASSSGSES